MDEMKTLNEVITSIGIPSLFFLLLAYALLKLIPKWLEVWQKNKNAELERANQAASEMQAYYNERNKSYQQQLDLMNKQSEQQNQLIGQATQVIARSNEVIANNTEAMRQNTAIHEKVVDVLTADREAQKEVVLAVKDIEKEIREHDLRSQKIYTTALRISDKIDTQTQKEQGGKTP